VDGVCTFTVSKFSASQLRMRILLNVHLVHGLEQRRLVAEGSPPQAATQASSSGAGQRSRAELNQLACRNCTLPRASTPVSGAQHRPRLTRMLSRRSPNACPLGNIESCTSSAADKIKKKHIYLEQGGGPATASLSVEI
jgi:hypothetical protein